MTAQTMNPPITAVPLLIDARPAGFFMRVFVLALVAGCFYFIDQNYWNMQGRFQEIIGAQSVDQLATSEMFTQSNYRAVAAAVLGLFGGLVLVFAQKAERPALGTLGLLVFFYVVWNAMSLIWADDVSLSLRRFGIFVFLALGAYGVQVQLTLRQIVLLAFLTTGLYLGLGVLAEYRTQMFTPLTPGYRFAGTLHPNAQAVNCALFLMAALSLWKTEKQFRWFYLIAAIAAIGFLYLTKSRTALLAVGVVAVLHWVFTQNRDLRVAASIGLVGLVVGGAILYPLFGYQLTEVLKLGRTDLGNSTSTLTGRWPVWQQAMEYAAKEPVLGYGYGGFWNEERTQDFIDRQEWPVPHAHNAFLDVMLDAGPLAALLYFFILILGIRRGYVLWRQTTNPGYLFLSFVLLFCLLNGMLESIAIQRTFITFLSMIAICGLLFRPLEAPEQA